MDAHAALVGKTLAGKYRLDALLGTGGFGAVYRGTHLLLDVPVAVKIALRADGAQGRRFRREAQLLMTLDHPGIVRMYDYGRDGTGPVYLVQAFIDGRTLGAELAEHGPLPPAVVVAIAAQVLDALAAAHAKGIIHRDIKPDNIMVVGPLDQLTVKLLDFGIAKDVDLAGIRSDITVSGGAPGTPAYMAPEQVRGATLPASDLYALGATMFVLLAGRLPFPEPVPLVFLSHLQDPVPALPATVPGELADLVYRAMAKDPGQRYASAQAMRDALPTLASQAEPASLLDPIDEAAPAQVDGLRGLAASLASDNKIDGPTADPLPGGQFGLGRPARSAPAAEVSLAHAATVEPGPPPARGSAAFSLRGRRWLLVVGLIALAGSGLTLAEILSAPSDGNSVRPVAMVDDPSPPLPETINLADSGSAATASANRDATGGRAPSDAAAVPTLIAAVDATQRAADRGGPADSSTRRSSRRHAPKRQPDPAQRVAALHASVLRLLGGCKCAQIEAQLDLLARLDPQGIDTLRLAYAKRCLSPGFPGGCL